MRDREIDRERKRSEWMEDGGGQIEWVWVSRMSSVFGGSRMRSVLGGSVLGGDDLQLRRR